MNPNYAPPEGFALDSESELYFRDDGDGIDPATGAPVWRTTWFNPETGEYQQVDYPQEEPETQPQPVPVVEPEPIPVPQSQIPEGFVADPSGAFYYRATPGSDPASGSAGLWYTYFYPETGEYRQAFQADAAPVRKKKKSLVWLWILIAAVVVVGGGAVAFWQLDGMAWIAGLLPGGADGAATPRVTATPRPGAEIPAISLDKSVYAPREDMRVTLEGVDEEIRERTVFMGIYEPGADPEDPLYGRRYPEEKKEILPARSEAGEYEVRLYDEDFILLASIPFAVEGAAEAVIFLDKEVYEPWEAIEVTVLGVTQEMADNGAFAAIYVYGDDHEAYQSYDYPQEGEDNLLFVAPGEAGEYEVRLYSEDYVYTDETFVTAVSFAVEDGEEPSEAPSEEEGALAAEREGGVLSLDKSAYQAGEAIEVTVTITEDMEQNSAFVAVYAEGEGHDGGTGRKYPRPDGDTVSLTAAGTSGAYEVRLYSDSDPRASTLLATVPFTVEGGSIEQSIEMMYRVAEEWGLELDNSAVSGVYGSGKCVLVLLESDDFFLYIEDGSDSFTASGTYSWWPDGTTLSLDSDDLRAVQDDYSIYLGLQGNGQLQWEGFADIHGVTYGHMLPKLL